MRRLFLICSLLLCFSASGQIADELHVGDTIPIELRFPLDGNPKCLECRSILSWMLDNPGMTLEVHSHTDTRGSVEENLRLSVKRSEFVMNWLNNRGIDSIRVKTFGWGEQKPLIPEDSILPYRTRNPKEFERRHARNRRTYAIVEKIDQPVLCHFPQKTESWVAYERDTSKLSVGDRIHLDFVKYNLARETLWDLQERDWLYDSLAMFLRRHTNVRFRINVHTDTRGSKLLSRKLSRRRAESLRQKLIDHYGVNGNRLEAMGFEEAQPIVPDVEIKEKCGNTPECVERMHAMNRRVELEVLEVFAIRKKKPSN